MSSSYSLIRFLSFIIYHEHLHYADKHKYGNLLIELCVRIIILSFISSCLSLGKTVTQPLYHKQILQKNAFKND